MPLLSLLLILAGLPTAATDSRFPAAREVFRCGFEEEADRDYDTWPDGWTRLRSLSLPHFVPVGITNKSACEGRQSLRMSADGAGAVIESPPFAISPGYS